MSGIVQGIIDAGPASIAQTALGAVNFVALAGLGYQGWRYRDASKDENHKLALKVNSLDVTVRNHVANTPNGEGINGRIAVAVDKVLDAATAKIVEIDLKVIEVDKRQRKLQGFCDRKHGQNGVTP